MVSFLHQRRAIFFFLVVFAVLSFPVVSENLRIGVGDTDESMCFPPYLMVSGDRTHFSGVVYDILAEILKITGDTVKPVFLSPARVLRGISEGTLDLDLFSSPLWRPEYSKDSIYSIPYLTITDYFVFPKGRQFPVNNVSDLAGKRLETVQEYHYGYLDNPLKDGTIIRSDAPNETAILKRLDAGWATVGIIDKRIFEVLSDTLKIKSLVLGDRSGPSTAVSIRFAARNSAERDKFNHAIIQLQKEGIIQRILAKYGIG